MPRTRLAMTVLALALILPATNGCVPDEGGWYGPGGHYGGDVPPGARRYSRAFLQDEWIGASQGEVLDHWGEPYDRAYWDYEERGDQTIGWGPYMAYVEVVRDPYAGRAGAVEHIYFVLDQDFRQVVRVEFGEEQEWWGGDVEIMLVEHEW